MRDSRTERFGGPSAELSEAVGRKPVARPSSRAEFRDALIDLIAFGLSSRRRRNVDTVELNDQTPLFDSGLIDSLAILELIAFVEDATGRPIPVRHVQMKNFGTIDRICGAFWPFDSREGAPLAQGGPFDSHEGALAQGGPFDSREGALAQGGPAASEPS